MRNLECPRIVFLVDEMTMSWAAAVTGMFALAFVVPAEDPAPIVEPPAGKVAIEITEVLGSGCPSGTAFANMSADNTAIGVDYNRMTVQVGPGVSTSERRHNCHLSLAVTPPPGFTYAITGVVHTGFAVLPAGAAASVRASFLVAGAESALYRHDFEGPLDDQRWQASDTVDPASLVWAPCRETTTLVLRIDARIDPRSLDPATTHMHVEFGDSFAPGSRYRLAWKTCTRS